MHIGNFEKGMIPGIAIGTRVPIPRNSRSIGPRFTSSDQTVARSTEGAAGRSLDRPNVTPPISRSATLPITIRRIILARAFDGRGMSMWFSH